MERVVVIGCPGSGKSTFCRALHVITGIPLFYLDMMFWNADKTSVDKSVFYQRMMEVVQQDRWIIDGNYTSTLQPRLQACDTVFFLDFPLDVCLAGIAHRRGRDRPDLPWIETENNVDPEFIAFVHNFSTTNRPKLLEFLAKYADKKIYTFTSHSQADAFLAALRG